MESPGSKGEDSRRQGIPETPLLRVVRSVMDCFQVLRRELTQLHAFWRRYNYRYKAQQRAEKSVQWLSDSSKQFPMAEQRLV